MIPKENWVNQFDAYLGTIDIRINRLLSYQPSKIPPYLWRLSPKVSLVFKQFNGWGGGIRTESSNPETLSLT